MKTSERIFDMRIKNVPDGDDWFGCALSEIMDIIDEVAQLEAENEALREWIGEDGLVEMAIAQEGEQDAYPGLDIRLDYVCSRRGCWVQLEE